ITDGLGNFLSLDGVSNPQAQTFETFSIAESPTDGILFRFRPNDVNTATSLDDYAFVEESPNATRFAPITGVARPSVQGDLDEGVYNDIPIGFTFSYAGENYNKVSASTNGWMTLGQNITNASAANFLEEGGDRPVLAPLWDNLDLFDGEFAYTTTGPVASRVFTAQWTDVFSPFGSELSFQVKLYEADGRIEYIYDHDGTEPFYSGSYSMGLTEASTGENSFISIQEIPMTAADTLLPAQFSYTREERLLDRKPAPGQIIRFSLRNLFLVTNTNDSGPGSLREAINRANDVPERAFVQFKINFPGPKIITLNSSLSIENDMIIDATTQPEWSRQNPVFLDGSVIQTLEPVNIFGRLMQVLGSGSRSEVYGFGFTNSYDGITSFEAEDLKIGSQNKPNFFRNNQSIGIFLIGTKGSSITGNVFDSNNIGIWLSESISTEIKEDSLLNNDTGALIIASPSTSIRSNYIDNFNTLDGLGLSIVNGSNNTVVGGENPQDANTII
ncbi:MAG: NosD domain-containing protein, partial [Bacteroidota bacterium]